MNSPSVVGQAPPMPNVQNAQEVHSRQVQSNPSFGREGQERGNSRKNHPEMVEGTLS